MTKVEIDLTTLRNLIRGTEQEVKHIKELEDDGDCPERARKRLQINRRSLEGSIDIAEKEIEKQTNL